ncbi:MAG: hypothetical protein LBD58_04740 [Treponema sp.]|jgi:hypothetical protein|nr:hypothetical protein [Treponema sp.]
MFGVGGGAASGMAAMIKGRLEERGVSERQIASIGREIAEAAAECGKDMIDAGAIQGVLSEIEGKAARSRVTSSSRRRQRRL